MQQFRQFYFTSSTPPASTPSPTSIISTNATIEPAIVVPTNVELTSNNRVIPQATNLEENEDQTVLLNKLVPVLPTIEAAGSAKTITDQQLPITALATDENKVETIWSNLSKNFGRNQDENSLYYSYRLVLHILLAKFYKLVNLIN